mmetsp:Transcript_14096/g.42644  ORF Transcript_14096/g.42644 Transcript_14096/m.42644 type:complete len:377 (+) Transcript_14096:71-1201(+)
MRRRPSHSATPQKRTFVRAALLLLSRTALALSPLGKQALAESPPGMCNPDPLAPTVNLTVLTTIPVPPSWRNETLLTMQRMSKRFSGHMQEIMMAFGENSRTPEIGEIRVVLDSGDPTAVENPLWDGADDVATKQLRADVQEAQRLNADKLDALATDDDVAKITAHVFGRQPTYAEIFRYASYALPNRVVALVNADVVLRNVDALDASAFEDDLRSDSSSLRSSGEEEKRLAIALTVRQPSGAFFRACDDPKKLVDRCDEKRKGVTYSFDGFVFASPLPATSRFDLLEEEKPIPVYMNEMGAENRAKQFIAASGHQVVDPCFRTLAEHWHCSGKMHHQRERVDPANSNLFYALGGDMGLPSAHDSRGLRCATTLHR